MRRMIFTLALMMLSWSPAAAMEADTLTVRLDRPDPDAPPQGIEVSGISKTLLERARQTFHSPAQWQLVFSVYAGRAASVNDARLSMAGSYTIEQDVIYFTPQYPFLLGQSYYAVFEAGAFYQLLQETELSSRSKPLAFEFRLLRPSAIPTQVERVYPTADALPENLLRFYIYFSAPIREGDFLSHIHLYDDQDNDLREVFFDNLYELWDPSHQRLTIILDPGRVKTGLAANNAMGRALKRGETYRLVIDKGWIDAAGNPLAEDFVKNFRVVPEDSVPPNHENWVIAPPTAGSTEPLILTFPEPLDHALLSLFLEVKAPDGSSVRGAIKIEEKEKRWLFFSEAAWQAGEYVLEADPRLEDLAANSLKGRFDRPKNEPIQNAVQEKVNIVFQVH